MSRMSTPPRASTCLTSPANLPMFPTMPLSSLPTLSSSQLQQMIMLATGKYGLDHRLLVEHVGRNLTELAQLLTPEGPILIVAGRGNNGSGGLAAARLLAGQGRRVWVVPIHEAGNYSGTPREQLDHLRHYPTVRIKSGLPKMKFSCVIDAAIGTGLEGPPRGRTQDVITVLNRLHDGCCVISLDVPTGVTVDDGSVPGDAVQATLTLSVGLPKRGISIGNKVGRLFLGDIGIPPALMVDMNLEVPKLPGFLVELI